VFDEPEAEKAGANGVLSASATASAIEACFVDTNMFQSICAAAFDVALFKGSAYGQKCGRTVKVKVAISYL
jgi:hypothetical protein